MEFVIFFGFVVCFVVVTASLLYAANNNNMELKSSSQNYQQHFWEDEHSSVASSNSHIDANTVQPVSSILGVDSDDNMTHDTISAGINPASGLPMMGSIDIAGNPYGTSSDSVGMGCDDFLHHTDVFSDSCTGSFDDSFSSFDDSFSSFDDY